MNRPSLIERLESKIDFDGPNGCWLWTAGKHKDGYGHVSVDGKMRLAHRVVYELLVGPIPEGKELDHVRARGCLHRHCVNPDHLEPVKHAVNVRRGNRVKTHCPRGHAYAGANLMVDRNGHKKCRICCRAAKNRCMARKRARSA